MIYLLAGENDFMRDEAVAKLAKNHNIEYFNGLDISAGQLADIVSGQNLFTSQRVIVIDRLSKNTALWPELDTWLGRANDTSTIILTEPKPDKRTKAYKWLQSNTKLIDCSFLTVRDRRRAESWLHDYAGEQGLELNRDIVSKLVERAIRPDESGQQAIIDQSRLSTVIAQLAPAETINEELIDTVMGPPIHENVFGLLETALVGEPAELQAMLARLKQTQDGHRLLGLLSSQAINLTALVLSGGAPANQVASDIGANSYALSQLSTLADKLTSKDVRITIESLTLADERLKSTPTDIWILLEQALMTINLNVAKK